MKKQTTAGIGPQNNPITRVRGICMTLFCMIAFLCGSGLTGATDNGDIPEFHLPSFDVDVFGKELTLPIPVKVVAPRVHKGLNGTEVTMSFNISETGKVILIDDDASPYDNEKFELACLMYRQLRTWRFEPARDEDGNTVAVKVELPVRVVARGDVSKTQLASISLKRPVIVAIAKK